MNRWRGAISSLFLVLCCLLSSVREVLQAPRVRSIPKTNQISSLSDERFAELKKVLPQRGVVGYVGEGGGTSSAVGSYYLTQYALAPLIVDYSQMHPLVIGNFPHAVPAQLPGNLQLMHDFGNGVLLLAGKDSK